MNKMINLDGGGSSRLVVCEKSGEWANRLRHSLGDAGKWIVETRSLVQLAEALQRHPSSLVLIELSLHNLERAAACVDELYRQYSACGLVAVVPSQSVNASPGWESIEWKLREIGVEAVIRTPLEISTLCRLWALHCRVHTPYDPTMYDRLIQQLPWPAA